MVFGAILPSAPGFARGGYIKPLALWACCRERGRLLVPERTWNDHIFNLEGRTLVVTGVLYPNPVT